MSDTLSLSPYLEAVAHDLDAAAGREVARRRRRTPLRIAALVVAGLILVAGTAFAASSLLGDPAPHASRPPSTPTSPTRARL